MLKALGELELLMLKQMEFPEETDEPFRFRYYKNEIKEEAKKLFEILNCTEFKDELKKYFKHITNKDLINTIKPGEEVIL